VVKKILHSSETPRQKMPGIHNAKATISRDKQKKSTGRKITELTAGKLAHGLHPLGDCVLGQLPGKQEPHRRLNLP
jgi:hypothetical protein